MSRNNHMVYLDCDGVLADFITGILKAMDIPFPGYSKWPWGRVFDIFPLVGTDWAEASKFCDGTFWAGLPWMLDGMAIYKEVFERFRVAETMLLTKPMDHDGSYTGKAEWVTKHMPELRRRLVPTHIDKAEFAFDFNHLLIDDNQENVENFIRAGGAAIQVPRPYNVNDQIFYDGNAVLYIADKLDQWMKLVNHPARKRYLFNKANSQ